MNWDYILYKCLGIFGYGIAMISSALIGQYSVRTFGKPPGMKRQVLLYFKWMAVLAVLCLGITKGEDEFNFNKAVVFFIVLYTPAFMGVSEGCRKDRAMTESQRWNKIRSDIKTERDVRNSNEM